MQTIDKKNRNHYDVWMQRFGENIRNLRKKRGWNQATLGEKAGYINVETINRIEHGQNTTTAKLYQIAAALEIPLGELLPEDERAITSNCHSVCPDNNPDHISYHRIVEQVLHSGNEILINVMMATLEGIILQIGKGLPSGSPTKGNHGPFSPDTPITNGDKIRSYAPKGKAGQKIPQSADSNE